MCLQLCSFDCLMEKSVSKIILDERLQQSQHNMLTPLSSDLVFKPRSLVYPISVNCIAEWTEYSWFTI